MKEKLKPYKLFSEIYDDVYFKRKTHPFFSVLKKTISQNDAKPHSVLDLACGTGWLLRELQESVYPGYMAGLDISSEMLQFAEGKFPYGLKPDLILGDFRDFEIDMKFDMILCFSDSINYITTPEELEKIFREVQQHLSEGGVFIFDVITEAHCISNHGISFKHEENDISYRQSFDYCSSSRMFETTIEFADGIEIHKQIPLEYYDVMHYANKTKLKVRKVCGREFENITPKTTRIFYIIEANEEL